MKVRFSVVAFVPPNAQLGVVGSAPFLGEWDVRKCLPLIPYSSPHPGGQEPSLWFRDVDIPAAAVKQAAAASALGRATADAGGAAACAAAAGDVAGAAVLNRKHCEDTCHYVANGGRGTGDASSSCRRRVHGSSGSWRYRRSSASRWLDRRCCCCGICFSNGSGPCVENSCSGRYFTGGECLGCTDSTRSTTSSSRRSTGNSGCVRTSSREAASRGVDSGCQALPAAAVAGIAEDFSFGCSCSLHHTAASVRDAAGLPGAATAAAAAAHGLVFCPTCLEEDIISETDFAWQLVLATSCARRGDGRTTGVVAGEGPSNSRTCCCCHTEHVNGGHGLPTSAAGCGDHWEHNAIQLGQQFQQLQRLQDGTASKREAAPLYYSAASAEREQRQSDAVQAPLRRCCRRRDQALSSVEGRGHSGATTAAGEHSGRGFVDGAAAGAHPSDGGATDSARAVPPSCCAHACFHREQQEERSEQATAGEQETCECNSVWDAAAYSIDPRIPAVLQLLESHPFKLLQFEYKYILWYPPSEKAAVPCFPTDGGAEGAGIDALEAGLYGSSTLAAPGGGQAGSGVRVREVADRAEEKRRETSSRNPEEEGGGCAPRTTQRGGEEDFRRMHRRHCGSTITEGGWREWLFPPSPPHLPSPPEAKEMLVWEGTGPAQNRRFVFDPFDVVVDLNRRGELQCLYICKIAHFRDPRAGGTGEYELTTRFYHSVRSESRMHFSKICPGLYVGSCPRQLLHIRLLKEELKVTCIFNLQTEQDICSNYPDPMATARSAEDVSHLCDSQGLRYVWLPTTDMCDSARKTACANAAFLLLGLIKSGHCVYVHCNAGVGRSVAAVSAFLCFAVGLDLRKVNFLICAKRPVAYWDEKAMKYGLGDYTYKYGKCSVVGDTFKEDNEETPFCCA